MLGDEQKLRQQQKPSGKEILREKQLVKHYCRYIIVFENLIDCSQTEFPDVTVVYSIFAQMEKTVEINETSRFLEDLEMLRTVPAEQLMNSVEETIPDDEAEQDGLGSFKFGDSNPLEQLGLYMKAEDEEEDEEEVEPPPTIPNAVNDDDDVEEGEID